eukprot:1577768-Amphidinium_carterae.2
MSSAPVFWVVASAARSFLMASVPSQHWVDGQKRTVWIARQRRKGKALRPLHIPLPVRWFRQPPPRSLLIPPHLIKSVNSKRLGRRDRNIEHDLELVFGWVSVGYWGRLQ